MNHRMLADRLRRGAAIAAGRATGQVTRRLGVGGGTTLPGLIAEKIDPTIVADLAAQVRGGAIVITGTNGKTTTSGLVAAALRAGGLEVWRNREGSNLMRGLATTLLNRAHWTGAISSNANTVCVLEVDEAALAPAVRAIQPRVIAITNLFRDQLDRYGEVDTVAQIWRTALATLPDTTTLVLAADDPTVARLGAGFAGRVCYYGLDDLSLALPAGARQDEQGQVIDARACPDCGADYVYSARFYSHVGHYVCPRCHQRRPKPDLHITQVRQDDFDHTTICLTSPEETVELTLGLPGLYNVYNAAAAATVAMALEIPLATARAGIEGFTPAFGRGERIAIGGRTVRILLAKNPTGFNEVFRALARHRTDIRHLLLILNDNTADGRDISWIWDAEFEQLAGLPEYLVVAGTRAADLGVRLKYAGVIPSDGRGEGPAWTVESDIPRALDVALAGVPPGGALYIVPTYTGMLAARGELERRGHVPHYWEESDRGILALKGQGTSRSSRLRSLASRSSLLQKEE
jgi:UDP-N-acetylmuramyl tripeptide synthase